MTMREPADPSPEDPDDAAAYWAMRRRSGTMTPPEEQALEAWSRASDENRRALAALEGALAAVEADGGALLAEEFERQLNEAADGGASRRAGALRIAASLAAVTLLSAATLLAVRTFAPPSPPLIAHETEIGEAATVALADGSAAHLNTASKIAVQFSRTERAVDLVAGEAFFEVEKDQQRPFVVRTANAAITVTGTAFDVLSSENRSSVHVVTGVVDVTPRFGPSSTLLAGDMIEIGEDGRASPVMRFDPSLVLAWRGGKARFRDEPLGDVVKSLNRYFSTPIVLDGEALSQLPVTGEFDIRDRDTAVRALALIFGLEARDEPARTVLEAPQPQ